MDEKEKLMLQAKAELDAKVFEVASNARAGDLLQASVVTQLLNQPYDAELPCPDVISETADIKRVPMGETAEYYAQSASTKTIHTISSGGITQANVSPGSASTFTFYHYGTPEDYLYIPDMLEQKYDSLANKGKDQQEAVNRKEQKDYIRLLFLAAQSVSQTYALTSGDTATDFGNLVEMVRALAKYGSKIVLITGSTVTTDVKLMPYTENKYAKYEWNDAGIDKWIKVETYQYTHSTTQTVMDADRALVIATSDSQANRPAIFARRKINGINGVDGQRERLTIAVGPQVQVGSAAKLAFAIFTYESYAAAVVNPYCVCAFQRASSYSNVT